MNRLEKCGVVLPSDLETSVVTPEEFGAMKDALSGVAPSQTRRSMFELMRQLKSEVDVAIAKRNIGARFTDERPDATMHPPTLGKRVAGDGTGNDVETLRGLWQGPETSGG